MLTELRQWQIPAMELSTAKIDRLFRRSVAPFIQEYQSKSVEHKLTPKLINDTWQAFWRGLGGVVDYKYRVPVCKLTQEKIDKIEEQRRTILLLPDDIFTPQGIVRLMKVFPLNWTGDLKGLKETERISHNTKRGGCIDVENQLSAPYSVDGGYSEPELRKKIESGGRRYGQRLPTYMVASMFSQLVEGHPFDFNDTCSRLLGSSYYDGKEYKTLVAEYDNSNKCINISNYDPQKRNTNMGGRSEGIIQINRFFWQRHQGVKMA